MQPDASSSPPGLPIGAASRVAIAVCDRAGRVLDRTAGVAALIGGEAAATVRELLLGAGASVEDAGLVEAAFGRAQDAVLDVRLVREGRSRWCLVAVHPEADAVTCVFMDSPAHLAKRALFRSVLDASVSGLVIHDPSGRVVEANTEAERLLGLTRDQLLGRTPMDPRWRATDADGRDFPGTDHPASLALRTGKPQRDVVMGIDLPGGGKRWLKVSAQRETDPADGSVFVVAAFMDVTAEREREQRLEAAHAAAEQALLDLSAYRAALDQHAIVAITDRAGRITYANDAFCRISGYSREELLGKTHRIVKSDEQQAEFFEQLWATISAGHTWHGEIRNRAKDGRSYWVDTSIIPLKDLKGRITSYVSIRRDITDRKATEHRLRAETAKLKAAIDSIPGGIVFVGPDYQMLGCNSRYRDLLALPDHLFENGLPNLVDVARLDAARGEQDLLTVGDIAEARVAGPGPVQRARANGVVLEIRSLPMPGGGWVASYMDVTDQVRAREGLMEKTRLLERTSKELEIVLAHMNEGVSVFDPDGRIVCWNLQYVKMFGMRIADVERGKPLLDLLSVQQQAGNFQDDLFAYVEAIAAAVERSEVYEAEARVNGRVIRTVHAPMPNGGWVATHEDVTEKVAATARIAHAASHDALTDLLNRAGLMDRLARELSVPEPAVAVLLVDLDRFKAVNDTLGHAAGDIVLQAVSRRLVSIAGSAEVVARLGGDEFAILCRGGDGGRAAQAMADRIVRDVGEPFFVDGQPLSIGASVGIALAPAHGTTIDNLIRAADRALYDVKGQGRGAFRLYTPDLGRKPLEGKRRAVA